MSPGVPETVVRRDGDVPVVSQALEPARRVGFVLDLPGAVGRRESTEQSHSDFPKSRRDDESVDEWSVGHIVDG